MTQRTISTALAFVLCLLLAVGAFAAPVGAGDNVAIFSLEPDELEAEAGETIELEVVVSTHGDIVGDGIDELSATLVYDEEVFTATEVTHGEMLAHGDPDAEVVGSADVDDGEVTINQHREPSGDGAATTASAATIELEVDPDAPTTNETIEFAESSAMLVSDYPQTTFEREATVAVEATESSGSGSVGIDVIGGFGAPAAIAALVTVAALAATGYWSRREP